jgi:hypothetical protein
VDRKQPKINKSLKPTRSSRGRNKKVVNEDKPIVISDDDEESKKKSQASEKDEEDMEIVDDSDGDGDASGIEKGTRFDMSIGRSIEPEIEVEEQKEEEQQIHQLKGKHGANAKVGEGAKKGISEEKELEILKGFDLNSLYGACRGISRMERYNRALKYQLSPRPEEIVAQIIEQHKNDSKYQTW